MNAQELIDELRSQNILLKWDGKDINWTAPFDFVPPDEIIEIVRENYDEIIKRIDGPPPEWLLNRSNIIKLTQGDCLGAMGMFPENLVDLIVTDPPYELNIMGEDWDNAMPTVKTWKECLRVLKPGGVACIMSSTRQDLLSRMIVNLQDAGFITRFPSLYWTYKKGNPLRGDISKEIKKKINRIKKGEVGIQADYDIELLAAKAKAYDGAYPGYNPRPAVEVIIIAMKPLKEKTYVEQVLSNGKGISRFHACRIPFADESDAAKVKKNFTADKYNVGSTLVGPKKLNNNFNEEGRLPYNFVVSDNILGEEDSKYYNLDAWGEKQQLKGLNINALEDVVQRKLPFLVVKKPSPKEKNFGCENIISKKKVKKKKSGHSTVKPTLLMSYLITMWSDEGELVLDPFCGTGTTCMAARLLKRPSIGIEKKPKYYKIAAARMRALTLATWGEESKTDTQPG
jgi:site-specific DNA-methyltransferase (adenine-specific)